jgi:CRISPR system Cascade subunit CasA
MTLGKGDFMHTQNQFNLVDEPWIPIAGHGLASLSDIFSKPHFKALGGNPIQKISVIKLLLAICQTAATLKMTTNGHKWEPRAWQKKHWPI